MIANESTGSGLVEIVGRSTPIHVLGDSHALPYKGLVFQSSADDLFYVTYAKHIPGFQGAHFVDGAGRLHGGVMNALTSEGLIVKADESDAWTAQHHDPNAARAKAIDFAAGRVRRSPILLMLFGDIEQRGTLIKQLAPGCDFELPGYLAPDLPAHPVTQTIPYQVVSEFAARLLAPAFRGLLTLSSWGFETLYVHTLPPQPPDDADYARINGYAAPARLRYKCTYLFNSALREFARNTPQIRLLDMWEKQTVNGLLDPAFYLDGVHLNIKAAGISVNALLADAAAKK
jgi:hypothetical protein